MAPDLNSLPTSKPPSTPGSPLHQRTGSNLSSSQEATGLPSPSSPHSSAAAVHTSLSRTSSGNAAHNRRPSFSDRRRSSLLHSLAVNDSSSSSPGEMQQPHQPGSNSPRLARRSFTTHTADPYHQRQPSLGEIHQELENEQEAQVNRLLFMIRTQQDQLAALQRQQGQQGSAQQGEAVSTSSPPSTEHTPFPTPPTTNAAITPASSSAVITEQSSPRSASHLSRHGSGSRPHPLSRRSSSHRSGSLGPVTEDFLLGGTRDECAFYQAETQNLTRENNLLRNRIRELEKQIAELSSTSVSQPSIGPTANPV